MGPGNKVYLAPTRPHFGGRRSDLRVDEYTAVTRRPKNDGVLEGQLVTAITSSQARSEHAIPAVEKHPTSPRVSCSCRSGQALVSISPRRDGPAHAMKEMPTPMPPQLATLVEQLKTESYKEPAAP
jgi:hypothetical protein